MPDTTKTPTRLRDLAEKGGHDVLRFDPRKIIVEPGHNPRRFDTPEMVEVDHPHSKVIEGEIVKVQPHERFALDMPSAKPISFDLLPDHRNPDYMMRGWGYFANPETCTHYRKRMTTATMKWRCSDCGKEF